MTLFLQQRSKLSTNFDALVKILPEMVNSSVAAHRIRKIAELPKERHDLGNAEQLEKTASKGLAIQMKDVDFSYVENKKVLTKSRFLAKPGEIAALVGPSGEGKTTILRMILGLIYPQNGEVTIRDTEGNEVSANADLRELFSYVPQGNTLFSGTIADNLKLAKEDASDAEMIAALKTACAWEFVEQMDGGLSAKVSERGRGISEGQAQRIAIARAVLRDAPVLLLDEATSALDVQTEQRVLQNIMKQHPNKTCIISTHRQGALELCQRIYRVVDKNIKEIEIL